MAPVTHEFFTVYMPQFNANRMIIPKQFVQHMRGKTSGSVHLTGPSGNTWTLQLVKNKDGVFLDKGWTTFVKDHAILVGEFLVFKYDGNSGFRVAIYGHNACEKKTSFYAKCSQPDNIADILKVAKAEPLEDSPKKTAGVYCMMKSRHTEFGEDPVIDDSVPMECKREEQRPTKTSPPPFFLVRIKIYNLQAGFLRIPTKFLKKTGLKYDHEDNIVLHNQQGQSKTVKLVSGRQGVTFSAGWTVFARKSNIKEGDVCMFELVNKYEMHMQKIQNRNTLTPPPPPPPPPPPHPCHPCTEPQQVKIEISD